MDAWVDGQAQRAQPENPWKRSKVNERIKQKKRRKRKRKTNEKNIEV